MLPSISEEKNRFLPRAFSTTSFRPGSKTGSLSKGPFHALILFALASTTVTLILGHFNAITDMVGPPT